MAKINFSFTLLNKGVDGKHALFLQLIQNRKIKRINLNYRILFTEFDRKRQRLKQNTPNSYKINLFLDNISNKINNVLFEMSMINKQININDLIAIVFDKQEKVKYKDFVYNYINESSQKYAKGTLIIFKTKTDKLDRYFPNLLIEDIDLKFLEKYKSILLNINNENTAFVDLRTIKKFIRIAIRNGIISDNPFDDFKIKAIEGNRAFLTQSEFQRLYDYYFELENETLSNVLRNFLFSCFTGLRFSDIQQLDYENIIDKTIYIEMQKNGKFHSVPICETACKFLDLNKKHGLVFKTLSNQKTNLYLKKIAENCGIYKNVTFHVARHTFATLNITLGTNIEVVSKLLGHASIKTTQIYAKVTDNVKIQAINKIDSVFG